MRKTYLGLWALFLKLGSKAIPVLAKLLKGLKLSKLGLAGASFATYSHLFTWQFAGVLMLAIFVHESGHVWGMRRAGVPTKGFYFIPFFGGAAVSTGQFPTQLSVSAMVLSGPLWGLALALLVAWLYVLTLDPLWAALASWMALINLFNLAPINPLDGGRILVSLAASNSQWLARTVVFGSLGALLWLGWSFAIPIFWFLAALGTLEFMFELGTSRTRARRVAEAEDRLRRAAEVRAEFEASGWLPKLSNTSEQLPKHSSYSDLPTFEGLVKCIEEELAGLRTPRSMTVTEQLAVLASYLFLAWLLWLLLTLAHGVPGADLAMKILQGL